ncbi:signal peptide peptidase SppA [Rhodospirillaceae bacterium SYSU D60014]|uniref:signal peptide peptidase SppA n=1 Tax=Virgifigura deserti TaxID=2268457 RepID=UPI000E668B7F
MILFRYLGRLLVLLLAFVGALAVLAIVAGAFFWQLFLPDGEREVPQQAVLTLDLANGLIETRPRSPLAWAALDDALVMREVIQGLEAAGRDDRIKGLVARLGSGTLEMAQAQELRDAIRAFREQGKFTVAFAETFGEAGTGNTHYYLATAFEEIWLQPSGEVGLVGARLETPFLAEVLTDIGIQPRLDQRLEYKGGMDMFTSDQMPEPVRENLQRLVESWVGQIASGIAATRKMDQAAARSLIDRGPFLAGEAKTEGLVDRLGYWDEVVNTVFARAGLHAERIAVSDYVGGLPPPPEDAPQIAVIYGLGPVQLAASDDDPFFGSVTMGSDTVSKAIREAIEDEDVAAIILRIDSPGGSYVASDTIWREVDRAREMGKPLIVSMANIAASGGYFVAVPAHRIVAQPGTVTGSIGVYGGKFVLSGLWDKLGVTWEGVQAGANADMTSANVDYSEAGWAKLQASLDFIYQDFVEKVAAGRDIPIETVQEVAQGKVWSGADAQARGLVDALGGIATAVDLAREAAGIAPEAAVQVGPYPPRAEGYGALLRRILGEELAQSGAVEMLAPFLRLMDAAAPIARTLAPLTQPSAQRAVRAPEFRAAQ